MRKPGFCICENKEADQLCGNREADHRLCFRYIDRQIVQSLFFLNTKFQASSHLVWLYSLVCMGPGRKPEDRFSHNEAHIMSPQIYLLFCIFVAIRQSDKYITLSPQCNFSLHYNNYGTISLNF